ncbi:MAG: OsmC family protein [Chloroflexi bacterium]|nr:OsmC family protein [Chloroflexota bacterium]
MASEVKVAWTGEGLRLAGQSGNGSEITLDHLLPGEEGTEAGPRPLELLLLGLAGCTTMDVVSILKKKRQPFTGLQVNVSAERAEEHPKVYTKIHLEFVVQGQEVKAQAVERAIELSQTTYCPAAAMLSKAVDITTSYKVEADGSTGRIAELEARIADLQARLPKHSVPASMLIELDELEEALEQAQVEANQ